MAITALCNSSNIKVVTPDKKLIMVACQSPFIALFPFAFLCKRHPLRSSYSLHSPEVTCQGLQLDDYKLSHGAAMAWPANSSGSLIVSDIKVDIVS